MAKKKRKKWNRVHYFRRKKSTKHKVGHPVYVYGVAGRMAKYLVFTHTPENDTDYEELAHNINPEEEGKKKSFVKKKFEVSDSDSLRDPDKTYQIHDEDKERIKKYKK